ncbi:dihydrodipicolinate synthase family protein [Desertivirga xinjiangensis]|uniref:dihydrodipicolinate synthase family protein n=1 Tax=Desertivirga xinjiangensis TaxID=539206 RepID=UPI00210EB668|nr:dihydrodipicolinate synthase family protein [Pedobacter xinjiangensis]
MNKQKKYQGTIVPVVTPVTADYKLDHGAVEKIFSHLYKNDALPFILGTTGESASLSNSIKKDYLKAAVANKKPGTVLYAGISSNIFKESVDFAKRCFDEGIDAVATTLPTYYRLSNDQIKRYFEDLANQLNGPLIIYNIPATTHMSIPLSVIEELSYHENIVGTKDSERCENRLDESLRLWADRPDFSHFLGWAAKSAYALINGGDGLIPSTGNLHPGLYYEMTQAVLDGDHEKAYYYQTQSDLLGSLYQSDRTLGESLGALKVLMSDYGLCKPCMMPPLQEVSAEEQLLLLDALHELIRKENIQINISLTHV